MMRPCDTVQRKFYFVRFRVSTCLPKANVSSAAFIVPWLKWCGIRALESSIMLTSVEPSFIVVLSLWSYRQLQHSPKVLSARRQRGFLSPASGMLDTWAPVPHQQWAAWTGDLNPFIIAIHPGSTSTAPYHDGVEGRVFVKPIRPNCLDIICFYFYLGILLTTWDFAKGGLPASYFAPPNLSYLFVFVFINPVPRS